MSRTSGFTLLELMVAISVAAVLLTMGVPSFTSTIRQNCAVSGANALLGVLTLARSEALKRGGHVTVCKSGDGHACARGSSVSWTQGFLIFAETGAIGTLEAGEDVIAAQMPMNTCGSVSTNSYANYISFDENGKANTNGSFFIRAQGDGSVNRTVSVFVSRVRVCDSAHEKNCKAPP